MTVDERRRLDLYTWAREHMGAERAETFMEHLLPVAFAEVATKSDIARLEARLDGMEQRFEERFRGIDHRFEGIDHRFVGIDHRFDAIDRRFDAIDHQLIGMRHEMRGLFHAQTNRILMWIVPLVMGSTTLSATIAASI